ncbi:hypothetical protein H0H92_000944 [Tricholoma furcatifolium]|nr:hypothetical protein H0H92_000944 [Tricholoma furcatifolium]
MEQGKDGVRRAGLLERYHVARFGLGLDSCVLMTAQYMPPNGHDLDKPTIYNALRRVVAVHPALGVRLSRNPATQDPIFKRLSELDLSQVVEFSSDCDLEKAISAQLLQKFDLASDLPIWRILVLKDNTICFAWHHGIGDGKSGLAFHRALLASLQEGAEQNPDPIVTTSKEPLVPALEALTDLTPPWSKVAQELYGLFAPVSWTSGAMAWTGNAVPTEITLQNRARLIEFSPEVATAFIALCRTHKATLTSTFHALTISVISDLIQTEGHKTISSAVPISLRHLSGTSNDAICNHVSSLRAYTKVDPVFSWAHASEYATDLRNYVDKSGQEIGMLKFLFGKYDEYFQGKLGKKRQVGFEISNVGRFDTRNTSFGDQAWSIGRTVFAQCDVVVGAALKLNAVGDPLGGVTMSVIYGAGSISDVFVDKFVENFKLGVENFLK